MAYEWVSPVCVGVVGAIGIGATLRTGRQGRAHVETMTKDRFDHELRLAREAREQERLSDAYVKLLRMVERIGSWAQTVFPVHDKAQPLDWPDTAEQGEVEAYVNAFGSELVKEAFAKWENIIENMIAAWAMTNLERADREAGATAPEYRRGAFYKVMELRPAERDARKNLSRLVSTELRARQD
jgi:hypothetical protein